MDFGEALAADELWGWPVEVLDQLLELRQQAWRGEISLDQWREQDAVIRTGQPDVDTAEVDDLQTEFAVNGPRDVSTEARRRLAGRLTALAHPAPTDEELWDELAEIRKELADRKLDHRTQKILRDDRIRFAHWLVRPGSDLDPVTGLPWSRVARYRVVHDVELGSIPQSVHAARTLAVRDAPAEESERADMIREALHPQDGLATAIDDLMQTQVSWLPRLLLDVSRDDDELRPLLDDLVRVWSDPRVQRLLIEQTAREWPAPFDTNPPDPTPAPAAPANWRN